MARGGAGRHARPVTPDLLLARADAAIDEAHALRVDRSALVEELALSRERLRESLLESAVTREQARQSRGPLRPTHDPAWQTLTSRPASPRSAEHHP
jgi:hypothetical protein